MKKKCALVLACAMGLSLVACGGENHAPEIKGVQDGFVKAGVEFDAFEGVTATDKEDGNITSKMTVEATPSLDFKNGKVTPDKAGTYELTYTITDKGGLTTEAFATLTVAKKTTDAAVYLEYDFNDTPAADAKGWEGVIGGSAQGTAELKQGAYVFDVTNPGGGDGDVQLKLAGMKLTKADYVVKIWAKSNVKTFAHLLARDEGAKDWATFGGEFNLPINTEIAPLTLNFSSKGEGSTELMLNMGMITPNDSEKTPDKYTVTVDKIEVFEITGEETMKELYSSANAAGTSVSAGDGANAQANGNTVKISSYQNAGGVWSIKADVPVNTKIEEGVKYYYSVDVDAANAQGGECLIESASQNDALRVNFAGLSLAGGKATISGTFTADKNVDDAVIRLQIGNASEGVTSNTLTFTNVKFGKVEGDRDTKKTTYSFATVGQNTPSENDAKFPFMTFNGTDGDADRGVGTIWQENGSFFYRIDNGGTVDWHNKLVLGYGEVPLTLEADSYYTVEVTAKATKEVSGGVFLNPCGGWDPRFSENMALTTEEQTFTFETSDTFVTDMNFELLFQFGSEATAQAGEVTIEISKITIYQSKVM